MLARSITLLTFDTLWPGHSRWQPLKSAVGQAGQFYRPSARVAGEEHVWRAGQGGLVTDLDVQVGVRPAEVDEAAVWRLWRLARIPW